MPCSVCFIYDYIYIHTRVLINTFKYHVFAPMGRFQLDVKETEVTSTPTRPVENVVITTKG